MKSCHRGVTPLLSRGAARVCLSRVRACGGPDRYRFRLTASAVNAQEAVLASSTAAVVVKVNTAPRPGTFVVSPNTGIELNTKFTLLAEGWTDEPEDYPLK